MVKYSPGSFAAVIDGFLTSPKFKSLAPATRELIYRYLTQAQDTQLGLGGYSAQVIRPALVQAFLDGYADRPGAQKNVRSAFGYLEKWAVVRDLLPHSITLGTECVASNGGHKPWTDIEVAQAEQYARSDLARVITLASNTGQRISDLYRMQPRHIETIDGRRGINVMRQKNGDIVPIWIPFNPRLIEIMDTWERRPGPFLLHRTGRPWKDGQELSNEWQVERKRNPKLKETHAELVLHGLRATAIVRLRRAGCTPLQISDMVGLTAQMVERYCRFSDQKQNAIAGLIQAEGGTSAEHERNKIVAFPKASD